MALVNIGGNGFLYPQFSTYIPATPLSGIPALLSATVDTAGEMVAYIGHVWFAAGPGTSKTVSSAGGAIQWRTGTITWAGAGSTIRVGLQDVSAASGPPAQPDEDWTGEPYAELVQGTDSLSSTTWTTSTIEAGSKTITHGDLIAVVFDMTVRNGVDSITVTGLQVTATQNRPLVVAKSGGTWATANQYPNFVITCDDGTLACFEGSPPASAVTTRVINTGSTPDEYGNIINLPFDCKVDGLFSNLDADNECEFNLYSSAGGTPVQEQQVVIDPNQVAVAAGRPTEAYIAPETLAAGSVYAVTVRPTTGSSVSVYEITVDAAAHLAFWPGGTNVYKCTRSDDTGTFTTDTSARIICGFKVSQIDDGTGPGSTGGGSYTFVS